MWEIYAFFERSSMKHIIEHTPFAQMTIFSNPLPKKGGSIYIGPHTSHFGHHLPLLSSLFSFRKGSDYLLRVSFSERCNEVPMYWIMMCKIIIWSWFFILLEGQGQVCINFWYTRPRTPLLSGFWSSQDTAHP